jgi:hypothetical protein
VRIESDGYSFCGLGLGWHGVVSTSGVETIYVG